MVCLACEADKTSRIGTCETSMCEATHDGTWLLRLFLQLPLGIKRGAKRRNLVGSAKRSCPCSFPHGEPKWWEATHKAKIAGEAVRVLPAWGQTERFSLVFEGLQVAFLSFSFWGSPASVSS